MTNNLPNLPAWHRVPFGTTIPANTPYAYAYSDGVTAKLDGHFEDFIADYTYYTERPILPPLPTEEGATIMVSCDDRLPPDTLLTRDDGYWFDCSGMEWAVDYIRAWAPVTIGEVVVVR